MPSQATGRSRGFQARVSSPGAFDLDRTLAALADPHRRRTIDLLRERPHRAGELAQAIGLPAPAMSRHLTVLRRSGLVEETHPEFDARVRIYALRPEAMAGLRTWLEETERLWSAQLEAFKAHIEGAANA
jgi:DNA-binding transcriptional ArsR family regulator